MIVFAVYINETLVCRRKLGKLEDPYAVAVVKDNDIVVGHIPRKISTMCSIFLKKGQIICTVTERRQYSADLSHSGMEIPCKYLFTGTGDAIIK